MKHRTGDRPTRPPARAASRERGSTSVFAVCVVAVLMLLAGLCIDGGRVLNARATLTDVCEQAARAGAQEVLTEGLRGSFDVVLDPGAARTAARAYLASTTDMDLGGVSVTTSGNTVTVTAHRQVPTLMLSMLGMGSVTVTVSGTAEAESGIAAGGV